ncbi:MAG: hypothetical protein IKH04_08120, partial [Kiritimatiellae bacterium]|nr:hypothetical protein [Kiritimatiellia bacterium]
MNSSDRPYFVKRRKPLSANIGLASVGLDTYWAQCPGLLDDMKRKEDAFAEKLQGGASRPGEPTVSTVQPFNLSTIIYISAPNLSLAKTHTTFRLQHSCRMVFG